MATAAALGFTTAVMATADAFLRESGRFFRPLGLTAAQYNVLNVLAPHPAGMSQRQLSDVLVVDRSNVTGLLDRMEKAAWVRRSDAPRDRRVYLVTLTPAGRRLWEKVTPRYLDVVAQVTRGMSAEEMAASTALLQRMAAAAAMHWQLADG